MVDGLRFPDTEDESKAGSESLGSSNCTRSSLNHHKGNPHDLYLISPNLGAVLSAQQPEEHTLNR